MPVFSRQFSSRVMPAVVGAAVVALGASFASAGPIPALEIVYDVDGAGEVSLFPPGMLGANPPSGQQYNYQGVINGPDWQINFNFNADPDSLGNALIGGGITAENSGTDAIDFIITILLPLSGAATSPALLGGSATFGVTGDGDGGSLTALGGPAWQALVDGAVAEDLHNSLSLTTAPFGSDNVSESFGIPGPSQAGPGGSEIGIRLAFTLGAGDQMSYTGVFVIVPAPGALALLGLGGLVANRRRRRC